MNSGNAATRTVWGSLGAAGCLVGLAVFGERAFFLSPLTAVFLLVAFWGLYGAIRAEGGGKSAGIWLLTAGLVILAVLETVLRALMASTGKDLIDVFPTAVFMLFPLGDVLAIAGIVMLARRAVKAGFARAAVVPVAVLYPVFVVLNMMGEPGGPVGSAKRVGMFVFAGTLAHLAGRLRPGRRNVGEGHRAELA